MFQKLKPRISPTCHSLAKLFGFLTLMAVGHDLYLWSTSDGFPFAFAALGWITKHYIPEAHAVVVNLIGVPTFNMILTPALKIPAAFLAGGLSLAFMGIGFILQRRENAKSAPKRPRPKIN